MKANNSHKQHKIVGGVLGNNRGSAILFLTFSLIAVFAFAVLAIEGAILMTTRTQLQAAADAAALAGASGLVDGDEGVATARAINFASYNNATRVANDPVVITAADVTFPEPNTIRVQTHRTRATGDALRTYFRRIIDPSSDNLAEMTAVAAARAHDVCGTRCTKPWSIPDRFDDANLNGIFDDGDSYDPAATGYNAPGDVGTPIILKSGNPQQAIESGIFFPVNYPPIDKYPGEAPLTGGDWYREWIAECTPWLVEPGDRLQLEPGNMVGPTIQGIEELIARDPDAQWDPVSKTIVNSAFGQSPRVGLVPFFDPRLPPVSGRNEVTITKIGAFFIESTGPGSQVTGRFIQIISPGVPCTSTTGTSFIQGIVLIE